jgi:ABC-type multidrug transport system fused ATPase/permease subunit
MITSLIILFTTITSVLIRDHLTAGTVGLMITYALQITNSLNLLVRTSSELETNIVSVERINEYAELNPEAPWEIPAKKPSPHWPTSGSIQYVNDRTCFFFELLTFIFSRIKELSTRYRENLQLVLKDVTVNIEHGDKVM